VLEVGSELRGRMVPVVYMAAKCGGTEWCLGFQQLFALDCPCFPVCHTECTVNKQTWNFIIIYFNLSNVSAVSQSVLQCSVNPVAP